MDDIGLAHLILPYYGITFRNKDSMYMEAERWKPWQHVVVVPFPFTDQNTEKRRPALVLSDHDTFNDITETCVLAMITSAKNSDRPLDTRIDSFKKAGLPAPSKVRMKIFTLDSRLILKKIGGLASKDQKTVTASLRKLMPFSAILIQKANLKRSENSIR